MKKQMALYLTGYNEIDEIFPNNDYTKEEGVMVQLCQDCMNTDKVDIMDSAVEKAPLLNVSLKTVKTYDIPLDKAVRRFLELKFCQNIRHYYYYRFNDDSEYRLEVMKDFKDICRMANHDLTEINSIITKAKDVITDWHDYHSPSMYAFTDESDRCEDYLGLLPAIFSNKICKSLHKRWKHVTLTGYVFHDLPYGKTCYTNDLIQTCDNFSNKMKEYEAGKENSYVISLKTEMR